MPVYVIQCPQCQHQFQSLVLANTKEPSEWVCSKCGSHEAKPIFQQPHQHPLEQAHGAGCPCCGG